MDITVITPLTEAQAREMVSTIRFHIFQAERHENIARQTALEFQRAEGWRVLGYANLQVCFEAELGVSWQHGYRLITAAAVDADIAEFSPMGETPTLPERHAREIAKLPAEKRYVAFDRARTMAAAEGEEKPTQRHIERAVQTVKAELEVEKNPVVARAVAAGEISPVDGVKILHELDALPPQHQAPVLKLMTEHGLRDSRLVVPLAEMAMRPAAKASKVLAEIERTGHVAGVPLAQATLTDLSKLKDEAQQEHIAESQEARRQRLIEQGIDVVEPKVITVYAGAPEKTFQALVRALPAADLAALVTQLMEHGPVLSVLMKNAEAQ